MAHEKAVYSKPKTKLHVFDVVNYIVFIIIVMCVSLFSLSLSLSVLLHP